MLKVVVLIVLIIRAELGSNLEVVYIQSFMVVSGNLGCPESDTA
jgi:hypothetical protein